VDLNSVYVVAQNLTAAEPTVSSATSVQTNENSLRTKDSGLYLQEELALLDDRLSLLAGLLGERSSLNGDTGKYYVFPKAAAVFSLLTPSKNGESSSLAGFDSFRVRGAYGEAGNRPNYGFKFTPLLTNGNIDGNGGIVIGGPNNGPPTLGDVNIEPERQREFELGTDLATKDQRLVVELSLYQRSISNLLLQRALPTSTGFTTQFSNGGGLRNRGVELALQGRPLPAKTLDWTSRATLTLNRSEVTELPDHLPFDITAAGFGAGLGAYRIQEGKSATQIISSVDADGNVAVVGDGEPDFRVGWSNIVNVGDFSFSALLDWQQGSKVINLTRLLYDGSRNAPGDPMAAAMRFASFAGGDPRPYIEDATFLKVREVSATYTLPKSLLTELRPLQTLQISVSGRNLLTFTHYTGLDPEVSNFAGQPIGRNYDVGPYPPSRTFWLSLTAGI
jgi:outer membrane receptor protein involved in Fe transport